MDMKNILNGHALKSLLKNVDNPSISLAVGSDEEHKNIPILIFTEQHLPIPIPEIEPIRNKSYEEVRLDGTGVSLALDDFDTQNFSIGSPYAIEGGY